MGDKEMTEMLTINVENDGVIATRSRASVVVNKESKVVAMRDLEYTFEESSAIADKLKSIQVT